MKSNHFVFLLIVIVVIVVIGCNKCSEEKPKPLVLAKPERVNEKTVKLLYEKIDKAKQSNELVIAEDTLFAVNIIRELYTQNNFSILWTDKGNSFNHTDSLIDIIKNADEYGLIPADYHFNKIDSLIKTRKDAETGKLDAVKLCEAELLLSDAFFTFVSDVSKGRLNRDSLTRESSIGKLDTNLVELLNKTIQQNNFRVLIDSLEPKNNQYQALKRTLKDFKLEFQDSDWDSLRSRESDSLTFNERLKERLIASHDYFEEYDGLDSIKLVKAIKNFQCKHHLTEDGKVGKLTFKALQRTKKDYIRQIEMNMERWRMYSDPKEEQYVWVNIPKYEMRVMEKDTLVMKSRVIVGAPDHQTPLLKSTIRYFLIYPYWTVPFSIVTKELLPILKRDTSYLRRKGFEVLDKNNRVVDPKNINWKKYNKNYFPWKLRQSIGEDNALGILKFNFENKYGVYMHDTDNRKLFAREMRSLSHGCVRLEKFIDFAQFLIRDDSIKYPVDSLMADLVKEKQKYVYIRHPLPVYINYFTAEVNESAELHFFIDIYRRDEKMLKALYRN